MSKFGKRRKQWTENGKKNHKSEILIKNCKPIQVKGEKENE